MKTTIYIVITGILIGYLGGLTISFSPFKIGFPNWTNVIGWIFLTIGIITLTTKFYIDGYAKGAKETTEMVETAIDEVIAKRIAVVVEKEKEAELNK